MMRTPAEEWAHLEFLVRLRARNPVAAHALMELDQQIEEIRERVGPVVFAQLQAEARQMIARRETTQRKMHKTTRTTRGSV